MQLITMSRDDFRAVMREVIKTEMILFAKRFLKKTDEEKMTRKEVARFLKCDLSTVHRWTVDKVLKKYGLGKRRVYYLKSEIPLELIVERQIAVA